MEEIKVGEYVRTKKGYIAKITEIDNYIWFNEKINKESGMAVYELSKVEFENLVVKQSKHIIDLIEEGDYVNGEKVSGIFNPIFLSWGELPYVIAGIGNHYEPQDIKTIVTKEQFEKMEYKIGS